MCSGWQAADRRVRERQRRRSATARGWPSQTTHDRARTKGDGLGQRRAHGVYARLHVQDVVQQLVQENAVREDRKGVLWLLAQPLPAAQG